MHLLNSDALLQGGKYRIIRALGQGGFGITYLAEQVALGRTVAIKEFFLKEYCDREGDSPVVFIPTEGSRCLVDNYKHKFVKEAQLIASLRNPHIVSIYDIFEENGTAYYVMEYLKNGSLIDVVKQSGPLPEVDAITYIISIGDALSYIHNHNILHLDVKPSNILLNEDGEVVLIDFGISKHYDENGGQTSTTPVGISKGYAPIEQYQQGNIVQFSPASDIYSLGATLYFLITGCAPPEATEVYEDGLPEIGDSVSLTTKKAIASAMASRRKDRPQSVQAFLDVLGGVVPVSDVTINMEALSPVKSTWSHNESTIVSKHTGVEMPSVPEQIRTTYQRPCLNKGLKRVKLSSILALCGILVIAIVTLLFFFNKKRNPSSEKVEDVRQSQFSVQDSLRAIKKAEKKKVAAELFAHLPAEPVFDIITNYGTIRVKLYSKTPQHRDNFSLLALEGFYDGLLFHRVINGFMIQGGDPLTCDATQVAKFGTGGADYTVPAEFVPEYKHRKGALAAARRGNAVNPLKASSGSQFYIVQNEAACAQLDGEYTVFGQTVSGLDVIDKIASVRTYHSHPPQPNDLPVEPVEIIEIRLVDGMSASSTKEMVTTKPVSSSLSSDVANPVNSDSQTKRREVIPYQQVQVKPTFQGKDANSFSNWVGSHLEYPAEARDNGVEGVVRVRFVVNIDGSVTNVSVVRGVVPVLDAEALRVVRSSPKWTPGYENNKAVRTGFDFAVVFRLK